MVIIDVMYANVKVFVTKRNDAIKRHSNVITIWRMSVIEVTALLKIITFRNERCARKKKTKKKNKSKKQTNKKILLS